MADYRTAGMPQQQQFQYQNQVPVQSYYAPVSQPFKGGFHPLYAIEIGCLVLTYGYIILFFVSSNFLKNFSATENTKLPLVFFLFPIVLAVANLVITLTYGRKLDRRYLLGASLILKYGLIPYFVFGGILIALAFLTGSLRSIPRYAYLLWFLTTAAFFFFLSAPGNMVRFREEALFWFPNYGLLGFTDKLLLGTAYTLGACLHEIYLPVLVLSVIVFLLMVAHRRGILLTLTAAFPMLYYGLYLFAKDSPAYAFVYNDVYGFYTSANWFATFLGMFAIIVTAFLIFIGIGDELDFKNTLFYCGAVAEQVVMGFTPTVAVSISRSSFFSRELLMIPICALLLELVRSLRPGSGDATRVSHKDNRGYYENS